MPYKVRCRLVAFTGDVERFPCHFGYEIGDSFTYDGGEFQGKICNGLLKPMMPVLWDTVFFGPGGETKFLYLYSGLSARDPSMKQYDGLGFRPLKEAPEGADPRYLAHIPPELPTELVRTVRSFTCDDFRTGAHFVVEPVDIASGGDMLTHYKRAMDITDKVRKEPGMTVEEILGKYTKWEREEIYPPLHPLYVKLLLGELATVGYVEMKDDRAYPGGRG